MQAITWDAQSYYVGGEPAFLVSGEFPYFRVPKKDWQYRMEMFKNGGGLCLSTYIPWAIHEPQEGVFAFDDCPMRNLEDFLCLAREMELYVTVRPGPYCYSEMIYGGLPEWLVENYPQIMAQCLDGSLLDYTAVSYNHPVFLEKARAWYRKVGSIIKGYMLEKGGPIAFVQIDNELCGAHVWNKSLDYNRESMGIAQEHGAFPLFLKEKYGDISRLNAAYNMQLSSFAEVMPLGDFSKTDPRQILRVKDYQDFYFAQVAEYGRQLVGWLREDGVTCSLTHNSGNANMNVYYDALCKKLANEQFLLGSDHYYSMGIDWDNNPRPMYMAKVFSSLESLRHYGFPPTVWEMPSGFCIDWVQLTPENLRCAYYLNLAMGMKGFNYYIFTGGKNPNRLCAVTDDYDCNAPIGTGNKLNPAYYVQKEFHQFLQTHSWLTQAKQESDFYVGVYREYGRSEEYSKGKSILGFSNYDAWLMTRRAVLLTGFYSSYSPEMIDLEEEGLAGKYLDKPLVVCASVSLSRKAQENLKAFVQNGGKLWLLPFVPSMDENMEPYSVLLDFFGGGQTRKPSRGFVRVDIGDVPNIWANESEWITERCPQGAEVLCADEHNGEVIAWKKAIGQGEVYWTGIQWFHSQDEHVRMLRYLMSQMRAGSPVVESSNASSIFGVVRTDGNRRMLFLTNLFSFEAVTEVSVRRPDGTYFDTGKHTLAPCSVKTFEIVEGKGGAQ